MNGPERNFPKLKEKDLNHESVVDQVKVLEPTVEKLSDDELKNKTAEFKKQLHGGKTLDEILPEAFAVVREVSERKLGKRHYDEQILAGFELHQGKALHMKTGEGKTLVATLAVYLNALEGNGVHVMTSDDSLARRDALEMAEIYGFLGLTSGVIQGSAEDNIKHSFLVENGGGGNYSLEEASRKKAYQADITYGTTKKFGFDYLNDSMAMEQKDLVQRGHNFAVVDEIDKEMIDEASKPLHIAGEILQDEAKGYYVVNLAIKKIQPDHYELDEASKSVTLTEKGEEFLSKQLGVDLVERELPEIFIPGTAKVLGLVQKALEAELLFELNKDYLLWPHPSKPNQKQVVIISLDGRQKFGQSWSDGLLQAMEAKENLPISAYNRTFESVTVQSYMQLYQKKSGMTGSTAGTEEEFKEIYDLEMAYIPTHEENIREDLPDLLFFDRESKMEAMNEAVLAVHSAKSKVKAPVLLGNLSIPDSIHLKDGLDAQLLNAYSHKEEDVIVAGAGAAGKVTIATPMLGRGTDIKLGGQGASEEEFAAVKDAGGLQVHGSRSALRRIDDQLKGRAGRQGEPGLSQFYVSLDDSFLVEYAYQSPSFREFWNEHSGKAGPITDLDLQEQFLYFIEKAQKWHAGVGFSQREELRDKSEFPNQHRQVFMKEKKSIMSPSADNIDDEYLQPLIQSELKNKLEMLHLHEGHESHPVKARELLGWLDEIQPTTELQGETMPSFGLNLLIKQAMERAQILSLDKLTVPKSRQFEVAIWEIKEELLVHEQQQAIVNIKRVFERTNFLKPAEAQNFIRLVNLLIPGQIDDFEIKDFMQLVPAEEDTGVAKKDDRESEEVVDKKALFKHLSEQIIQAFEGKISVETGIDGALGGLMAVVKFGMIGQRPFRRRGLSNSQAVQLAAQAFLEKGRVRGEDWWFVQDKVVNSGIKELEPMINDHFQEAWEFNEQYWEPYFDENQKLMDREGFKKKKLLVAMQRSWTDYLSQLEILRFTTGLGTQGSGNPLGEYNSQATKLFDQMLQDSAQDLLESIYNPEKSDIPDGKLTAVGSYHIKDQIKRLVASSDLISAGEFVNNLELLQRAFLAQYGYINVHELLESQSAEELIFSEELLKIVDQQIVVFGNDFADHEQAGVDVAFSSQVSLPKEIKIKSANELETEATRKLTGEEKLSLFKLITRLTQLRALQRRFQVVSTVILNISQHQVDQKETFSWLDPYEGVRQTQGLLAGKIATLEDEIDRLMGKIETKMVEIWTASS